MKVSREWLQTYFERPLPKAKALAEALTFHAFEIEGVENDVLDVNVTPNRGHDCLSHRGIARELSAILKLPMKADPLREKVALEPEHTDISVYVEDATSCPRFTGALIRGIAVGPSPDWLVKRLEAVGQKSINNVVDATNYVMLNIGQPLHAFDLEKTKDKGQKAKVQVKIQRLQKGERFTALDDRVYDLPEGTLVIADGDDSPLSIAGIKGGRASGVSEGTKSIFLEAANWDGVTIRRTSQALKLRTDASDRFQQVLSPELAAHGLRATAPLIVDVAGGEVVGYVDEYPNPQKTRVVSVSTEEINNVLGTKLSNTEVEGVLRRLDFPYSGQGKTLTIRVPFERLDVEVAEDLIEEVGRIVGYDAVPSVELPSFEKKPEINPNFYAAEKAREELVAKGYSEVYTSVFAETGERAVLNKVGGEKPYLRTTLTDGLREARKRNERNEDLLGLSEIRLFEIGAVWRYGKELMMLGIADAKGVREEALQPVSAEAYDDLPTSALGRYRPFSRYPSVIRDIALWVPESAAADDVLAVIREHAGEFLVRSELFDTFEKEGRTSFAFRLVFQSPDRTLTDYDANARMERIYEAVKKRGWEVR